MEYKESIEITEELVEKFAEITGDKNPIHMDGKYAESTIFGKRIAHGMLVASYFSKIIANVYPGEGSIYVSQSLQFIKPCYIGETLMYVINLIKKDKNKYFIKTETFNKNKELILTGEALIIKKEP